MKLTKTLFCMLLVFALTVSLTGCLSLGDKVKFDKDGNVIIKGGDKDGNELIIGAKEWNKSQMHGLSAPKAEIETSLVTDDGAMYGFSGMKEKDAKDYIEAIKEAGFTYNSVEFDDFMYTGTNKDGEIISFTYEKEDGTGTIVSSKGEAPSEDDDGNGAVVGGEDKKWESESMGGLPDPGTKVSMYWTDGNITNYILEEIPSFKDYVEEIKACGFTEDIDEMETDTLYVFSASNSEGDRVTFSTSEDMSAIAFEKAN